MRLQDWEIQGRLGSERCQRSQSCTRYFSMLGETGGKSPLCYINRYLSQPSVLGFFGT